MSRVTAAGMQPKRNQDPRGRGYHQVAHDGALGAAVDFGGAREYGPADLDQESTRNQAGQHRMARPGIECAQTRGLSLG